MADSSSHNDVDFVVCPQLEEFDQAIRVCLCWEAYTKPFEEKMAFLLVKVGDKTAFSNTAIL